MPRCYRRVSIVHRDSGLRWYATAGIIILVLRVALREITKILHFVFASLEHNSVIYSFYNVIISRLLLHSGADLGRAPLT